VIRSRILSEVQAGKAQSSSAITLQKASTSAFNKLSISRKKPKTSMDEEKLLKQKNSVNLKIKAAALGRFITFKRLSLAHCSQL